MIARVKTSNGNYNHATNRKGEPICLYCGAVLERHDRCRSCNILLHRLGLIKVDESGVQYGRKSKKIKGICTLCEDREMSK